jgi:hypothetical protein
MESIRAHLALMCASANAATLDLDRRKPNADLVRNGVEAGRKQRARATLQQLLFYQCSKLYYFLRMICNTFELLPCQQERDKRISRGVVVLFRRWRWFELARRLVVWTNAGSRAQLFR